MKFIECFIVLTLLSVVNCLPINMICVPVCNPNITVSVEFVNEWLNHSSATGVYQLRNHKDTVIHDLLNDASTDVSQLTSYLCSYLFSRRLYSYTDQPFMHIIMSRPVFSSHYGLLCMNNYTCT